ncbi:unnamed protein product, partial [Prorocentrum cordatum]
EEAAAKLRKMCYVWPDGEKVSFEQHSLRWLSKAFAAYGPPGPVTDIVNLAFGMMSNDTPRTAGTTEGTVVDMVLKLGQKIMSRDFRDLWIPTHFAMDAETDDSLCWLLLEYIHRVRGSKLNLMIQLPTDPVVDGLATDFAKAGIGKILRDPDSANANAIKKYWAL